MTYTKILIKPNQLKGWDGKPRIFIWDKQKRQPGCLNKLGNPVFYLKEKG
jgi:hypothetical protein